MDRHDVARGEKVVKADTIDVVIVRIVVVIAPPHEDLHAVRLRDPGDVGAVATVAEDPEGAAAQRPPDEREPLPLNHRPVRGRNVAQCGNGERERQLGDGGPRAVGTTAQGHRHPALRHVVGVEMVGVPARLQDELQRRQALQRGRVQLRALANGHEHADVGELGFVQLIQRSVQHADIRHLLHPLDARRPADQALPVIEDQHGEGAHDEAKASAAAPAPASRPNTAPRTSPAPAG